MPIEWNESALSLLQIDLESVFALNPDVAPDEEIPSPEGPSSNFAKTSKLPKVWFCSRALRHLFMLFVGVTIDRVTKVTPEKVYRMSLFQVNMFWFANIARYFNMFSLHVLSLN